MSYTPFPPPGPSLLNPQGVQSRGSLGDSESEDSGITSLAWGWDICSLWLRKPWNPESGEVPKGWRGQECEGLSQGLLWRYAFISSVPIPKKLGTWSFLVP